MKMDSIVDALVRALIQTGDIHSPEERLRAYFDAGIDFSMLTLEAIRAADREAIDIEMNRRISRS